MIVLEASPLRILSKNTGMRTVGGDLVGYIQSRMVFCWISEAGQSVRMIPPLFPSSSLCDQPAILTCVRWFTLQMVNGRLMLVCCLTALATRTANLFPPPIPYTPNVLCLPIASMRPGTGFQQSPITTTCTRSAIQALPSSHPLHVHRLDPDY